MSAFVRRMLGAIFFVIIVSFVVALASTIIFVFDVNGAKGLLPLIFFCLMVYFLLSFVHQSIFDDFANVHNKVPLKNVNLILGITSAFCFFLSLFVFWI